VDPELEDIATTDPFDRVLGDFLPNCPPPQVIPPTTDRERTPFLKFMNWDNHLAEQRADPSQRQLIRSLCHDPLPEEHYLSKISVLMEKYIRWGMDIIKKENQAFTIRKTLVHGEHIPRGS
jgi:hypothetical protein